MLRQPPGRPRTQRLASTWCGGCALARQVSGIWPAIDAMAASARLQIVSCPTSLPFVRMERRAAATLLHGHGAVPRSQLLQASKSWWISNPLSGPLSDLATAKAASAALLGVPPQTGESYYVGFEAKLPS